MSTPRSRDETAAGPEAPSGVTDADRHQAIERLRAAAAAGRLTDTDLAERTRRAHVAASRDELASLSTDIPAAPPRSASPRTRWVVATIAHEWLGGRWAVPGRLNAVAVLGDVTVDLREAELREAELAIHATALCGDVRVIVPPGALVDLSVVSVIGTKRLNIQPGKPTPPIPVIRLSGIAILGDVVVANDPPKRWTQSIRRRFRKTRSHDGLMRPAAEPPE